MIQPTCRELLDRLHANCPLAKCPACELNARVEKVLTEVQTHRRNFPPCEPGVCAWCDIERLLNGKDV